MLLPPKTDTKVSQKMIWRFVSLFMFFIFGLRAFDSIGYKFRVLPYILNLNIDTNEINFQIFCNHMFILAGNP